MLEVITLNGHRALKLENGCLRMVVLPQKGADIYELSHLPSGVQFLMHTPWGLKPPSPQPPMDFLENYEGGWQVLFPNINDPCHYRGRQIPFHGEAALLAWQDEVVLATEQEVRLRLWVDVSAYPLSPGARTDLAPGRARFGTYRAGDQPRSARVGFCLVPAFGPWW
jgi:hypothetical protein